MKILLVVFREKIVINQKTKNLHYYKIGDYQKKKSLSLLNNEILKKTILKTKSEHGQVIRVIVFKVANL